MTSLICETAAIKARIKEADLKLIIEVAKSAASLGGDILMKHYRLNKTIENKGRIGDLVTNADIEAEQVIIRFLKEKTPDIGIYAEESGSSGSQLGLTWCIDPLDGTTNYAHGFPLFATSIGLVWENLPLLGAISVPFFQELYWAAPTIGSFCNNEPITVSSTSLLRDSLLVTGFAYDRHTLSDNNYAEFCALTHKTRGVRRGGAAAVDMAFIANGRLDGYWERGLSKWDLAAGVPIVELAGGIINDYKTNNFDLNNGRIIACTPLIEKELKAELSKVKPLKKSSYMEEEVINRLNYN